MEEFKKFNPFFEDGSYLKFVRGKIDEWCIEMKEPESEAVWPKDKEYFSDLLNLGKEFGNKKVFEDFKSLYIITVPNVNTSYVEKYINRKSLEYGDKWLLMKKTFYILYMGMIAELNRDDGYAINGKYAKVLGVYQVLFEGFSPEEAAEFSKGPGKSVLIRKECERLGLII